MNPKETQLYKATVILSGEPEEVPVYAFSLDEALDLAEQTYGQENVHRVRPVVVPSSTAYTAPLPTDFPVVAG